MKVHSIAGANDLTLHVEETGNPEGKPLLFTHGFSQCRLSWARQMGSDLARDFRLIAIDIRGHGLSGKPRDQYGDPMLWAKDINAVIGTLGLSNPILIGWSYGGVIISDYLAMYGDSAIGGSVWVGAVSRLGAPLVDGGFLGAGFLDLVPGFFSEDVVDSTDTLQRFLRLCVHEEPSPQDFSLASTASFRLTCGKACLHES